MSDLAEPIGWGAAGAAVVFLVGNVIQQLRSMADAENPQWRQFIVVEAIGLVIYATVGAAVAAAFRSAEAASFVSGMTAVAFVALIAKGA